MRRDGSNLRPYVMMVALRADGRWWPAEPVKAFRTLDTAVRMCRDTRLAWLRFTWPQPQILRWHVIDVRDGTRHDPTRSKLEGINGKAGTATPGRLF